MKSRALPTVAAAAVLVACFASSVISQPQSTAQRRCIVEMNRGFDRVGRAQGAVHRECVRLALSDKLGTQTLQDCFQSDPGGEVAEARELTVQAAASYCPMAPDFGYTDAATVNAAAVIDEQQMIFGLFGPNVNVAIVPKAVDAARAQCVVKVVRGVERIMKKKRIEFRRCKNDGIRSGAITSQAELEQCYDDVKLDVRQKIVNPIAWLERAVAQYCDGQSVDLNAAFPGRCVGAPDFSHCGNEFTDCRMCISQNTADGINESCDLYDNGVSDNSCLAVACGNGVTEINEGCDDGNTSGGDCCSATCTNESSGSPCSDGNVCTDETCDGAGTCNAASNTAACDDGVFCNGADTCAGGTCSMHAGDPCAGGTECADTCNESADNCLDLIGAACGAGADTECTNPDECDGAGACLSNHEVSGTLCGDSATDCTNQDLCDGSGDCADNGFQTAGTGCTDDGNGCTDDECDGAGTCDHTNNVAPCTDGLFCNGADTCSGGSCSVHPGNPCPGPDADGDCQESCNEALDNCLANDADGSLCGAGQCQSGVCVTTTCVAANGLTWCFNPNACGEACNAVCAAFGLSPIASNAVWFAAQDTLAECQAISQAFGLGTSAGMGSFTFACLEDNGGIHAVGGGLNAPLLCSTFSGCPANHRTGMDSANVPCGPAVNSRRSVCPCE